MWNFAGLLVATTILTMPTLSNAASVTLYEQNFEAPNSPPGFINGYGSGYKDLSQQQVNVLYGGQPAGFSFAQAYTVETVLLTGTQAFGTGYSDPSGIGGNHAISMLSSVQNDLLGLSFNVGSFGFFNFTVDVSSLGADGIGGPFTNDQSPPEFQFTLFDNPSGALTTGSGTILGQANLVGTSSAIDTLDWTNGLFAFDTSSATNGNVTLQVDLLSGGYAVMDNFMITASDEAGGGLPPPVPAPAAFWLLGTALAGLIGVRKRKAVRSL